MRAALSSIATITRRHATMWLAPLIMLAAAALEPAMPRAQSPAATIDASGQLSRSSASQRVPVDPGAPRSRARAGRASTETAAAPSSNAPPDDAADAANAPSARRFAGKPPVVPKDDLRFDSTFAAAYPIRAPPLLPAV
jgi:hypothetical protein